MSRTLMPLVAAGIAALLCAAPAGAAPDDDPAPSDGPIAAIGGAMAQAGSAPAGPFGLPDLAPYAPALLLAQNAVPQAPGTADPAAIPALSAFVPAYLLPQNVAPAAPGDGVTAPGIGPDAEHPGTGRIAFLRRIHDMYEAGLLRGSLLGQQSPEEFLAAQQDPVPSPAG